MSNYFQKIASRSVRDDSNRAVLPEQSPAPYQPEGQTTKEEDEIHIGTTGAGDAERSIVSSEPSKENLLPLNSPLHAKQEIAQTMLPAEQRQYASLKPPVANSGTVNEIERHGSSTNEVMHKEVIHNEVMGKQEQLLQPNPTIIEKISQRNVQNTVVVKQMAETQLVAPANGNAGLLKPFLAPDGKAPVIQNALKKENKPVNEMVAEKPLLYPGQVQGRKASLLPVQKENMPVPKQVKPNQDNKLVIGRITVEVINTVQAAAKHKEPVRQNNTNKVQSTNTSGINKFSFGLGQL